jgi:hypothetical protein
MRNLIVTVTVLLATGCSMSPQYEKGEHDGLKLYSQVAELCRDNAFDKYPVERVLLDVKKTRNKNIKTGERCTEIENMSGSITTCKDVYKTVVESFYVKEYVDINWRERKEEGLICRVRQCEQGMTLSEDTDAEYDTWQLDEQRYYKELKMSFCAWGDPKTRTLVREKGSWRRSYDFDRIY